MTGYRDTPEREMLRSSVAKIASEFGHRYYVDKARRGEHTDELWDALAAHGFAGVNVPEAHEGGGMGMAELAAVQEELAAQGCPLLLLVVSPAICGSILTRFGTDAQKSDWLGGIGSGRERMVFAITEADAGSNSHRLRTKADRDGTSFLLNGSKQYISGLDEAQRVLVVARTGQDDRGRSELSLFVVDTDAPGVRFEPIPTDIVAPERQFTLFLDDVEVNEHRLVGPEGGGLRTLFVGLNPERIMASAMGVGLGRYSLGLASEYARSRTVWDQPIGAHQGISHPLARAKVDLELARLMLAEAAWLYDSGKDSADAANMAKFAGANAANICLDRAIQTHGGNGMASEYGLADLWGMTRLLRIAPVSEEMVLNHVAQHALGLPKSY